MASRETSGSFTSFTCLQIRRRFLVMALDDSKDHVDWWMVGRPVDWLATSVWSWMSWTSHCTSRAATDYMTASSDHRLHVNRLSVLHIASSEMIGPLSTRVMIMHSTFPFGRIRSRSEMTNMVCRHWTSKAYIFLIWASYRVSHQHIKGSKSIQLCRLSLWLCFVRNRS